jgi:hypothetical protein
MTVEDLIRTSMAAKAESPPDLPGLYGDVAGRVRVLRRRRRTAAVVATCVVVVAIAVPVLVVGGRDETPPTAPATPIATTSSASPTPRPVLSSVPTPSARPSRLVVGQATPSPPAPPALNFPVGGAPALPLLVSDGKQTSLQQDGTLRPIGASSGTYGAVRTPRGIVVQTSKGVEVILESGKVTLLPHTKGWTCGTFLTPDRRYLVLGRQAGPGPHENGTGTLAGDYALYDLDKEQILDRVHEPKQGCPAAVLSDGRILMGTGDGAVSGAAIWTPTSGLLTPVTDTTVRVVGSDGTSTPVRVLGADGQGCGFYRPGSTGTHGYLGFCGPTIGAGDPSTGLVKPLRLLHLMLEDWVRLDHQHLQVIVAHSATYNDQSDLVTYRWVLTCVVPAKAALSCVQNQQFAPAIQPRFGFAADQPVGPQPYLVH